MNTHTDHPLPRRSVGVCTCRTLLRERLAPRVKLH